MLPDRCVWTRDHDGSQLCCRNPVPRFASVSECSARLAKSGEAVVQSSQARLERGCAQCYLRGAGTCKLISATAHTTRAAVGTPTAREQWFMRRRAGGRTRAGCLPCRGGAGRVGAPGWAIGGDRANILGGRFATTDFVSSLRELAGAAGRVAPKEADVALSERRPPAHPEPRLSTGDPARPTRRSSCGDDSGGMMSQRR